MESTSVLCSDCDSPNPQWASVNRGVLLCDECNSIHRQLGRHVSQTKHLSKSLWRPTQLRMVQYLAAAGANRFWEHLLLEPYLSKKSDEIPKSPKIRSKPQPNSPLHPKKAEFIREKYLFNGFFKSPRFIIPEDLNYQLHASVRTSVLETSLYLLAMGANPNFIHPTKGTSPMHVACQYEQVGQLELLIAYGGDVCSKTTNGVSVLKIALEKACVPWTENTTDYYFYDFTSAEELRTIVTWSPLIDCIISTFYEVTDCLSFYLYRHTPNHKASFQYSSHHTRNGEVTDLDTNQTSFDSSTDHFLITPTVNLRSSPSSDVKMCHGKLTSMENTTFQDLCVDVYDEADRRYTNAILNLAINDENKIIRNGGDSIRPISMTSALPIKQSLALFFLPPNTAYSSVRNQARQKLGRLSVTEFRDLVVDVLTEAASRLAPILNISTCSFGNQFSKPEEIRKNKTRHNYSTYETSVCPPVLAVSENSRERISSKHSGGLESMKPALQTRKIHSKAASRVDVFEDPVYDQVPSELEHIVISSTSTNLHPVKFDTIDDNFKAVVLDDTSPIKSQESLSFLHKSTSPPPLLNADDIVASTDSLSPPKENIEPIQFLGSRRLHLSATNRFTANRASVPIGFSFRIRPDQETTPPITADTRHFAALNNDNAEFSYLEAKFEMGKLNQIILEKNSEKDALLEQNNILKETSEKLENRVKTLELLCDQLREENNALRAAFSAGMVLSHKKSNCSSDSTFSRENSPKFYQNPPNDLKNSTSPAPSKPFEHSGSKNQIRNDLPDNEPDYNDDLEQYSYSDDVSNAVSRTSDGNYSVGNQCHDSGILLRQGISLWGASSSSNQSEISQSPSSASKIIVSQTNQQQKPASSIPAMVKCTTILETDVCSRMSGRNQIQNHQPVDTCAYSNVTPPEIRRNLATQCPVINSKEIIPIPVSNMNECCVKNPLPVPKTTCSKSDVDTFDDYTAPNETGSPTPAPILPVTPHFKHIPHFHPLWPTSACTPVSTSQLKTPCNSCPGNKIIQREHDIAEYSSANPKVQSKLSQNAPVQQSESRGEQQSPSNWKQPPYERIVRGVECIIVRIRGMLEAANARRQSELSSSSKLIQLAVQDMVALFPPISKCKPTVGAALTILLSNSQRLRLHCENMQDGGVEGAQTETNPLINFAHEIASAAKTILTFYQKERH